MKRRPVYDVPTRIFHWVFFSLFATAFFIAKTQDDESPVYAYHMLAGITLNFAVLLRIIWGFIGSKHARFSSFALRLLTLLHYFKSMTTNIISKWAGHNPASSWTALIMITFTLGLGVTGILMTTTPNKESFEDIHEIFANGLFLTAIFHVLGIIIHTLRHKDNIGLSMINGKKTDIKDEDVINSSHRGVGILMLVLIGSFNFYLNRNYDIKTKTLNLFGNTLQLGENKSTDKNELDTEKSADQQEDHN